MVKVQSYLFIHSNNMDNNRVYKSIAEITIGLMNKEINLSNYDLEINFEDGYTEKVSPRVWNIIYNELKNE